jgi:hypothetical protein
LGIRLSPEGHHPGTECSYAGERGSVRAAHVAPIQVVGR